MALDYCRNKYRLLMAFIVRFLMEMNNKPREPGYFEVGGYMTFRWRLTRKQSVSIAVVIGGLIGWLATVSGLRLPL
jgi:hypothetical protein